MENQDRELILGLANRLRQAQPVQKDPQAAQLITQYVGGQPDALYLLVQAVLVQEDALRTAQARIAELQAAPSVPAPAPAFGAAPAPAFGAAPAAAPQPVQPQGGGFMSRMFGQNRDQAAPVAAPQGGSGGGFLKTAAAAAAGVAGGVLLFQGLSGAFGGHEGHHADGGHGGWDDQGGWDDGEQW